MADEFSSYSSSLDSPATRAAAVNPSNTTDLPEVSRALYIGGAGDIELIPAGQDTPVTFTAVAAGTILPVRTSRVRETTTATNIVALS